MPQTLSYTAEALADLNAIRSWLTQPGSGQAARRRLLAIRASIRKLRHHPCLYGLGAYPDVPELPCDGGYRALYEIHPDTGHNETAGNVVVLHVFGPGQSRAQL
jgi:plasmid stabilization system protein ParE